MRQPSPRIVHAFEEEERVSEHPWESLIEWQWYPQDDLNDPGACPCSIMLVPSQPWKTAFCSGGSFDSARGVIVTTKHHKYSVHCGAHHHHLHSQSRRLIVAETLTVLAPAQMLHIVLEFPPEMACEPSNPALPTNIRVNSHIPK